MKTKQTTEKKSQGSAACFRDVKRKKKAASSAFNPIAILSHTNDADSAQAKLNVSSPEDRSEKEADAMADHVVEGTSGGPVQEAADDYTQPVVQRQEEEEEAQPVRRQEEEEEMMPSLQRQEEEEEAQPKLASGTTFPVNRKNIISSRGPPRAPPQAMQKAHKERVVTSSGIDRKINREASGSAFGSNRVEVVLAESKLAGRQLDPFTMRFMEERMQADFSRVRIHTDDRAAWMCQRLNARAFAHGGHVYFNQSEYDTQSKDGRRLIAHELTHTIQQGVAQQQQRGAGAATQPASRSNAGREEHTELHSASDSQVSPHQASAPPAANPHRNDAPTKLQTDDAVESTETSSELDEAQAEVEFQAWARSSQAARNAPSAHHARTQASGKRQPTRHVSRFGESAFTSKQVFISRSPDSNQGDRQSAVELRGPPAQRHETHLNRSTRGCADPHGARAPPVLENTASNPSPFLSASPSVSVSHSPPVSVQRIPFGDTINDYANDVPGWRLLTVIVGYNPLTERDVDRTATNFLGGVLALMPGGSRLFDKLNAEGVVDDAFAWLSARQQEIGLTYNGLVRLAEEAWDEMSLARGFSYNYNIIRRKVDQVIDMIIRFASALIDKVVELLREKLAPPLLTWVKEQTRAYPLLTVIIGNDPITGAEVERTIPAIIEGFLMLTETGEDYWNKIQESGKLDEAIAWLDATIQQYDLTPTRIIGAFTNLWDSLGWEDVLDPIGTFGKIYDAFAGPVTDILGFVAEVALKILALVKDYFIGLLKEHANSIPGYPLLTVVLGRDPLTGEEVPRTAMNFIRGFLSLIPGGMETFANLEESGAIDKAFAWLEDEVEALDLSWEAIQNMFSRAWDLLTIESFLDPIGTFTELMDIFAAPVERLLRFAVNVGVKILEFVFEGFLLISGPFGQRILDTLKRTRSVFEIIWKDPMAFAMNIIRAVKKGMEQFVANILVHLRDALLGWLFGSVAEMITMPAEFNLMGILDLGLQIIGLTYANFRTQLVERIGEENVARLETAFEFIRILVTEGLAAAWEKILEYGENIIDGIIDGVKDMVVETIVKIGMQKLALLLAGPYGAVVEAIITTYNFIKTLIERINQILDFVTGVLDAIEPIANGDIDGAANLVELSLKRGLTMLISFLAGLIGLGGIPAKVRDVILRMHGAVSSAMGAVIDWVIARGRALFGMGDESQGDEGVQDASAPFPTTEATQHTAEFDADTGDVTIHSIRHPVIEYLDRIEAEANTDGGTPLTSVQNTAISTIKTVIHPAIQALRTRPDDSRTTQPGVAGGQEVNQLLNRLTTELAKLPDPDADSGESSVMPPSTIVGSYGTISTPAGPAGLTADSQDGESVEVKPLSINPGSLSGSSASYNSPLLTACKARSGVYVAGHLLHAHLGGPGNDYQNLAPITNAANISMFSGVETTALNKINNENKVLHYKVNMNYPSSRSPAPYIPAEGFIPTSISFSLHTMKLSQSVQDAADAKSGQEKIDFLDAERVKPASWVDDTALPSPTVTVSAPVNTPVGTTDLNTSTGSQIATRAGVSRGFAAAIVTEAAAVSGGFADKTDVRSRLTAGANRGQIQGYRASRSTIFSHMNRLVARLNDDLTWQAKLKSGSSGDSFEREADATADHVVGRSGRGPPTIHRMPSQSTAQAQMSAGSVSQGRGTVEPAHAAGSSMSTPVRREMESGFGADFSSVRVHTDSNAVAANQSIQAKAFTHGNDIYFNQGEYNPTSAPGKHLLAHELTHTVQQGASGPAIQRAAIPNASTATPAPIPAPTTSADNTKAAAAPAETPIPISFAPADDPAKEAPPLPEEKEEAEGKDKLPTSKTGEDAVKGKGGAAAGAAPGGEDKGKKPGDGEGKEAKEGAEKPTKDGPASDPNASSDEAFLSMTSSTASSIARQFPGFGKEIETKLASDAERTEANTPVLVAENTGETEAREEAVQEVPDGDTAKLTENVPDTGKTKPELKEHKNRAPPPDPSKNDSLLDKQKISVFLSWFRKMFGGFLRGIATRDNGVNTNAGKRPKVKLTGKSNPDRAKKNRGEGDAQAAAKKDEVQTAIKNNKGEDKVQPVAVREENKILITAAKKDVETKEQDDMRDYLGMDLPENVRKGADQGMAPLLDKSLAKERAKVKQGAKKRDTDKKAEVKAAKDKTAELNKNAKSKQDTEIKTRRNEIGAEKKRGREEADKLNSKFGTQADKEQNKTKKDIDKKVKEKEKEADKHLKDGETRAKNKKKEEEDKAAKKKRELKKAQKKKSWWDRVCDAVKSAVKAITNAIKSIFNALRKAVAAIINAVKKLALAAIEAARKLVVGLLDAFGKFLKSLVNTFLKDLFPGLAKRINKYIDKKIDQAKKAVNDFADKLKKGVEALANALTKALNKILSVFETLLTAAVGIAGALLTGDFAEAFRIAIESACSIAGIDPKPIFDFFEKAGSLIGKILRSPVKFIKNCAAAAKKGVNLFTKNIVTHLVTGVIDWLTGAMSDVPIVLPKTFDLRGVFSIVMQVLGLTYDRLKAKLIKEMGPGSEKVIGTVEKGVSLMMEVKNDFPMALWVKMQEKWKDIQAEAKATIQNVIIKEVVTAGVVYVLSLLNPASAIVKAVIMLYKLIMFFIENKDKIVAFLKSLYDSINNIVNGAIDPAAKAVEKTLARTIPLVLDLLAKLLSLGGIGTAIRKALKVIHSKVDKIINPIIKWVAKQGRKLLKKGGALVKKGKDTLKNMFTWWKHKETFKAEDGGSHKLYFEGTETSAKLFVASKKTLYTDFLASLKVDSKDKKRAKALTSAKSVAAKIDKERGKAVGGKNDAEKKANQKKKATTIQGLMGQLRTHTVLIMGALEQSENPIYNPTSPNNSKFAKGTTAKKLTKIPPKSGAGSTPTMAKHSIYDLIDKRRQGEKGASFYIRGHLLNHNLYGKGEWNNMTPLTRDANSTHEKQVESKVKAAVDSGDSVEYKITPNYSGQAGEAALIKEIKKKDVGAEQKIKIDIVKAEKHVPKSMTCTAKSLNKSSSFSVSYTVDNSIGRSYSDYQLGAVPKPDPVALSTATKAELMSHDRMTQAEAKAVIAARKKDGVNFVSYAEFYTRLNNESVKAKIEKLVTENLVKLH